MRDLYKGQVKLLIDILVEVAKEECFALHGGTAINLFHLNMPRFSVDIDLTFVPFSDTAYYVHSTSNRDVDLNLIRDGLSSVKNRLGRSLLKIRFDDERRTGEELKLLCSSGNATVKIEVNQINRGLIDEPCTMVLCSRAEEEFNRFCEIRTVSAGQLWGGKVNAALDRQHPRDIFDVKNMLGTIGFTDEVKRGFLFFLLCGKRPISEVLRPNFINQRVVFESQFAGMTDESFSYEEFEEIREKIVVIVNNSMTDKEKAFLRSFLEGTPKWENISSDWSMFPAVKWKQLNINRLKRENFGKFKEEVERLGLI